MPFKLVAVIESSISLGSILMIEGVHVIHIDTLSNRAMKTESAKEIQLLPKIDKKKQSNRFHHPLGKTASQFVLEHLQQHKMATWAELGKIVEEQGFSRSSVNNAIQRLIDNKQIIRTGPGLYAINQKKNHE